MVAAKKESAPGPDGFLIVSADLRWVRSIFLSNAYERVLEGGVV